MGVVVLVFQSCPHLMYPRKRPCTEHVRKWCPTVWNLSTMVCIPGDDLDLTVSHTLCFAVHSKLCILQCTVRCVCISQYTVLDAFHSK